MTADSGNTFAVRGFLPVKVSSLREAVADIHGNTDVEVQLPDGTVLKPCGIEVNRRTGNVLRLLLESDTEPPITSARPPAAASSV